MGAARDDREGAVEAASESGSDHQEAVGALVG